MIHDPTFLKRNYSRIDEDFALFTFEERNENEKLNEMIRRSFEIDFVNHNEDEMKAEDTRSLKIMNKTCKQRADKHWEIGLLWKNKDPCLPKSKNHAMKLLIYMERKFL